MSNIEKVVACFKEYEFEFDNSIFEQRLKAQKINYLLQAKGLDNGYSYFLHFHGPYSRVLADDLFHNSYRFPEFVTNAKLTTRERDTVNNLRRIFGDNSGLLEIGATYGYYCMEEQLDPLRAFKQVKKFKSGYSDGKIAIGISKAKEFLFNPDINDYPELVEESTIWQNASAITLGRLNE